MEKNNKGVLILLIVLLIICSGLSVWGFTAKMLGSNQPKTPENINRQFKFNNKLYFYDMLTLIGTYDCINQSCNYAQGTIDDTKYSLNYYSEATEDYITLISKRYAFIVDEDKSIKLYDVVNGNEVNKFQAVKNYGVGINNNYYIVEDFNDKWGVMNFDSTAGLVINYKYDFIGLHDKLADNSKLLDSDLFVVKDVNGWKIVNSNDVDKSTYFTNQIYDYNDKYVITKNNIYYYIYNSNSGSLLSSSLFTYAKFAGKYIAVVDSSNDYYILNPSTLEAISQKYKVSSPNEVTLEETQNGISLSIGSSFKELIK